MDRALEELLEAASQAEPGTRITFRDPIAAHGTDAIEPMERWLADERLGTFAVRVLSRIADTGRPRKVFRALRQSQPLVENTAVLRDIDAELKRLRPGIELLNTIRWMRTQGKRADGSDWTEKDALRLLAKIQRYRGRRRLGDRPAGEPLTIDALRALQFRGFEGDPYRNNCWGCKSAINSSVDARCAGCLMFFCGSCGACMCNSTGW